MSGTDESGSSGPKGTGSGKVGSCLALLRRGDIQAFFPATTGVMTIGRDPACAVFINDPRASKRHSRVLFHGSEATIEDLGSRNGTRVNERKIKAHILVPGDVIRIGRNVFIWLTPGMPHKRDSRGAVGLVAGHAAQGQEVNLAITEAPLLFGRAAEADIQTTDEGVVDFHMQIIAVPGGAQVTELSAEVPRCRVLSDGDSLECGSVRLEYKSGRTEARPAEEISLAEDAYPAGEQAPAPSQGIPPATSQPPSKRADEANLIRLLRTEAERVEEKVTPSEGPRELSAQAGGYTLTITSGPHEGKSITMTTKTMTVGRDKSCDICLIDKGVSRSHARILRVEGDLVVEDVGSANGVFINGERINRCPLRPGDILRIGASEFLVHL